MDVGVQERVDEDLLSTSFSMYIPNHFFDALTRIFLNTVLLVVPL